MEFDDLITLRSIGAFVTKKLKKNIAIKYYRSLLNIVKKELRH